MSRPFAALYLRVSTVDRGQEVNVQEELLLEWVERLGYEPVVYAESGVSGATTSRPVLDRLMADVRRREVQAVAVLRLDRLGRSLSHLLQLLSEFERALIAERVKDGLAYAKSHGTKSGRPIGRPRLSVDFMAICDALRGRSRKPGAVARVAREFGVSRGWLYKWVIPTLDGVTNTLAENGDQAKAQDLVRRGRHIPGPL